MKKNTRTAALLVVVCLSILGVGASSPFTSSSNLNQRLEELEKQNVALRQEVADLKIKVDILTDRVNQACAGSGQGLSMSPGRSPRSGPSSNPGVPDLRVVRLSPETTPPNLPRGKLIVEHEDAESPSVLEHNANSGGAPLPGTNYVPLPDPETTMKPGSEPSITEQTMPASPGPSTPAPASTARDEPSAYQEIKSLIDQGDKDGATPFLEQYLKAYPKGIHVSEVASWLGDNYFSRNEYQKAIKTFSLVTEDHPESNQAPDALFKIGLSWLELNQASKGAAALREVKVLYPFSSAAEQAEQKLKSCCQ
jgi:tol-pal system protein YbgF